MGVDIWNSFRNMIMNTGKLIVQGEMLYAMLLLIMLHSIFLDTTAPTLWRIATRWDKARGYHEPWWQWCRCRKEGRHNPLWLVVDEGLTVCGCGDADCLLSFLKPLVEFLLPEGLFCMEPSWVVMAVTRTRLSDFICWVDGIDPSTRFLWEGKTSTFWACYGLLLQDSQGHTWDLTALLAWKPEEQQRAFKDVWRASSVSILWTARASIACFSDSAVVLWMLNPLKK